jgi:hypothetical protein
MMYAIGTGKSFRISRRSPIGRSNAAAQLCRPGDAKTWDGDNDRRFPADAGSLRYIVSKAGAGHIQITSGGADLTRPCRSRRSLTIEGPATIRQTEGTASSTFPPARASRSES